MGHRKFVLAERQMDNPQHEARVEVIRIELEHGVHFRDRRFVVARIRIQSRDVRAYREVQRVQFARHATVLKRFGKSAVEYQAPAIRQMCIG